MKTEIIEDINRDNLHHRLTKVGSILNDGRKAIVHLSIFFDDLDEKHKAVICYYE